MGNLQGTTLWLLRAIAAGAVAFWRALWGRTQAAELKRFPRLVFTGRISASALLCTLSLATLSAFGWAESQAAPPPFCADFAVCDRKSPGQAAQCLEHKLRVEAADPKRTEDYYRESLANPDKRSAFTSDSLVWVGRDKWCRAESSAWRTCLSACGSESPGDLQQNIASLCNLPPAGEVGKVLAGFWKLLRGLAAGIAGLLFAWVVLRLLGATLGFLNPDVYSKVAKVVDAQFEKLDRGESAPVMEKAAVAGAAGVLLVVITIVITVNVPGPQDPDESSSASQVRFLEEIRKSQDELLTAVSKEHGLQDAHRNLVIGYLTNQSNQASQMLELLKQGRKVDAFEFARLVRLHNQSLADSKEFQRGLAAMLKNFAEQTARTIGGAAAEREALFGEMKEINKNIKDLREKLLNSNRELLNAELLEAAEREHSSETAAIRRTCIDEARARWIPWGKSESAYVKLCVRKYNALL